LVADFDTEVVVLVPDQRKAHRLDAGLSLVFTACDGETSVEDLIEEISAGTQDSVAATEVWLANCLRELEALGVFEPTTF
jgi:hypothetical protein